MGDRMMDQNKIWKSFGIKTDKQNPRALAVNTVLAGKYLVGPVLGEGGFGITYAGYDLNMEARIAIKEYFPVELVTRDTTRRSAGDGDAASEGAVSGGSVPGASASDGGQSAASVSSSGGGSDRVISLSGEKSKTYQQGLKKYVDEARNVSQFADIPGIVSVKDFFYENNTAYIVMEYIEGISLKEYLKQKGGKVSEEEALAILRPVLEALEKVHAAGIVHRDISPDNIMLTFTEEGKTGAGQSDVSTVYGNISAVKLIDFGAARMTSKNDQKSLTIILKHGYAPEEQYRSHGEQGSWTDVYALCAVLYRMLTGKVPEPAMDRLFSDELKRPEELGAKVSQTVSEAIMRGLAVKKEDRIQTVQELMDVLYAGKKLKRKGENLQIGKYSFSTREAALAAGCVFILVVGIVAAGIGLTGRNIPPVAQSQSSAQSVAETGEEDIPETSSDRMEAASGNKEEVVTLQEDEVGEQIVFPDPQTSISGVQDSHTLFLLPDGTVKALGGNAYGQCLVQDWTNMAAVSAGRTHSLGLRTDGRVFAAGDNAMGQCDTGAWENIVAIAAGDNVSFGLRIDGTIEACGWVKPYAEEISSWKNIRSIAAAEYGGLIGLDEEGMVHYAGFFEEMPEISDWKDVHFIGYGRLEGAQILGLCEDGSVRRRQVKEYDYPNQYAGMEDWTQMQQIGGNTPGLGVKKDGTAVWSDNADPALQEELKTWTGLKAVSSAHIWDRILVFGLKEDGTILEYRQNMGNAELSDMKNLEWIQVIPGFEDNLAAVSSDGRLLTFGLEGGLSHVEMLLPQMEILPGDLSGLGSIDTYLCKDGTLYGTDDMTGRNLEESRWSESGVRQAIELWNGGTTVEKNVMIESKAFAMLMDSGQVKIRQFGDPLEGTGIGWENDLLQVKEAENWTNVVQILGEGGNLYGLHGDGTVSTTVEQNREALEGVSGVRKIAGYRGQTSALDDILALMEDGTVRPLIFSDNSVQFGRTQTESWTNVKDIAVGESHVAGLLANGTVIAAGSNHAGQCNVEGWENIVFLTAGRNCTLGITADGDLLMAGSLY